MQKAPFELEILPLFPAQADLRIRLECNLVHWFGLTAQTAVLDFQAVPEYGRTSGVDFGPVDVVRAAEAFRSKGRG
jgi:acetolactate synthase I/II/III large subunit